MKYIMYIFMLSIVCMIHARLSDQAQQVMLGAVVDEMISIPDGLTVCEQMQYYLNNTVSQNQLITSAVLNTLIHKEFDAAGANIDSCDLSHIPDGTTVLSYAAYLEGLVLTNGSAKNAKFSRAHLNRADFTGTDATGGVFDHAQAHTEIIFTGANLTATSHKQASYTNVVFTSADLTGANFYKAKLQNVTFTGTTDAKTNLTNTDFTKATLNGIICDPDTIIVSNTIKPSGAIASSAADFCSQHHVGITY